MTSQGADEKRARHYLHRTGARPIGHQEPPVPNRPIIPTQIIPAGAPLPARPPEPDELPPWRTPPPPPPPVVPPPPVPPTPQPAPPPPQIVHHIHEVLLVTPEPDPAPPLWARAWDWLWDHLVTWRMLLAIVAALTPWLGGQSPVGAWSATVHQARTDGGILAAYVIAGVALAAAWVLDRRSSPPGKPGRAVPRFLLVTATLGAVGVFDWWDPILMLTGVHR